MDGHHNNIEEFNGDLEELMREFHRSHYEGAQQRLSAGGDIGASLFGSKNLDVSFTYGSEKLAY